ncbi:MAG: TetR/AcrR family transcriptional regulator [Thermodesulfobacteriota bacterium]
MKLASGGKLKDANLLMKKFENFTEKGKGKNIEICKIAAKLFNKRGYLSTTLNDIARDGGITKGGIYHYFSTKEELLFVILYRYMDKMLRDLKQKIDTCHSPEEKIRTLIRLHIYNYRDNLAESHVLLRERKNLTPEYLDIIKNKEREYEATLRHLIESLLKKKKKQVGNIKLVTYSLLGMCNWPFTWFNPEGKASPDDLSDIIYRIFMRGILSGFGKNRIN